MITKKIQQILIKIQSARHNNNIKNPVRLVAVSKTKTVQQIKQAYDAGQRHFGQNYVDQIQQKQPKLPEDIKWHFIGHLQSNKIKKILVPNLFLIETIDRQSLAQKLNKQLEKDKRDQAILIQVKTSDQQSKSGVQIEELDKLYTFINKFCPRLIFKGLMTIGKSGDLQAFGILNKLKFQMCQKYKLNPQQFELSMGMSGDFQQAVFILQQRQSIIQRTQEQVVQYLEKEIIVNKNDDINIRLLNNIKIIKIKMKMKDKNLQQYKLQKQNIQQQYKKAFINIVESHDSLKISLDYAEKYINSIDFSQQKIQDYSPILISRMIFDDQLKAINNQFNKLPNQKCRIEHFIIIMLKVMKFQLQKQPLYMIGLKDMFFQIVQEGKNEIVYEQFFKYILGQLIIMKQEQQSTQFQVKFQQNKRQDYLVHDNGIKKIYYSNDLKILISIDEKSKFLKFYNQQMKNISKYSGKKQFHNGVVPYIIDFDYSQMTMRLGVIFSDSTIQSINLPNFLYKSQSQFQSTSLNLLRFNCPQKMIKITYIHMINKWFCISQDYNHYLFDLQKIRLKPEQVIQKIEVKTGDGHICQVLQIINLSMICLVAANQIYFYDETLSKSKCSKFSHHETINVFKYCEQYNRFYLSGVKQKSITTFTINRNRTTFKIKVIPIYKTIVDFEIFPSYETILICDEMHEVRLFNQISKTLYKSQNYSHIVKNKKSQLSCFKISKTQFIIFQSYMIICDQQKIAMEIDNQYNFLPYYYYDHKKQQFYISVNDQIISFSLTFGQTRKNYSNQSSNVMKHKSFFMGSKTSPFILDNNNDLFEIYLKSDQINGENRYYKKRININDALGYHYDEQMRNFMIIQANSLTQIRNDYNNSFNAINNVNFQNIGKIVQFKFCTKSKYLTFLTQDQIIYQFQNFETHISKCFKFEYENIKNEAEQRVILQYEYCNIYQILLLLNNKNEIVIVQRLNLSNYIKINIKEYLPHKLKHLIFNKMNYFIIKQNNKYISFITLIQQNGFIFQIPLDKIFKKYFQNTKKQEINLHNFIREQYQVKTDFVQVQHIIFNNQHKINLANSQYRLQKLHEKQLVIFKKIKLQIIATVTIFIDGSIKIWNQSYQLLSQLKIPSMYKLVWNMSQILTIKNKKSIQQLKSIMQQYFLYQNKITNPKQILIKKDKIKHLNNQKPSTNNPMSLQLVNQQIQDLLLKTTTLTQYKTNNVNNKWIRNLKSNPQKHLTIDFHPWRKKKEFVKIYDKASPQKYTQKLPQDLLQLRTSLDMANKKRKKQSYKQAQLILPQLKQYNFQNSKQSLKQKQTQQQKQTYQTFQSCLYVKTQRKPKKINELDQIDRQFFKKIMIMQGRKTIFSDRKSKLSKTIQINEMAQSIKEQSRYDLNKQIHQVVQQHNKFNTIQNKGRIIKIPQIRLSRQLQ